MRPSRGRLLATVPALVLCLTPLLSACGPGSSSGADAGPSGKGSGGGGSSAPTRPGTGSDDSDAKARALISKAMLDDDAMARSGLSASIKEPLGGPHTWSNVCNVKLESDHDILSEGVQQWQKSARTVMVQSLVRFHDGDAVPALQQAVAAAKSCATYKAGDTTVSVLAPVQTTSSQLTYCRKSSQGFTCTRAGLRGDHINQIVAFGGSKTAAQESLERYWAMATSALKTAGL